MLEVSDYEKLRLENIERNHNFLNKIGISIVKKNINHKNISKQIKTSPSPLHENIAVRRSDRLKTSETISYGEIQIFENSELF